MTSQIIKEVGLAHNQPNRLGIIGGVGPYASALLYKSLIQQLYKKGRNLFEMMILDYPFSRPHAFPDLRAFDERLQNELQGCTDRLQRAGCDLAVVVCNTLHAYLTKIDTPLQFIHLPQTVAQVIAEAGVSKLLVLATAVVKRDGLYSHRRYASIFPNEEEQKIVDGVIQSILEGTAAKQHAELLEQLIRKICEREGCDGVVLGCTDLPVLHDQYPLQSPCRMFDSVRILAEHLSNLSLI